MTDDSSDTDDSNLTDDSSDTDSSDPTDTSDSTDSSSDTDGSSGTDGSDDTDDTESTTDASSGIIDDDGDDDGLAMYKISVTPRVEPQKYVEGVCESIIATYENVTLTGNEHYKKLADMGYIFEFDIVSGYIDHVGKSELVIDNVRILLPGGEEYLDESLYNITVNKGKLHLYAKKITVTSLNHNSDYTGDYVTYEKYEIEDELLPDHTLKVVFGHKEGVPAGIKNAGSYQNYFTCKVYDKEGNDVSDLYLIDRKYGYITVKTIGTLVIKGDDTTMSYQTLLDEYGGTYRAQKCTLVSGTLFEGHKIASVSYEGNEKTSISKRGRLTVVPTSVVIVDEEGNDVTANYSFSFQKATITITK